MPLPRSLANLKREISEKKWMEARRRIGGRASRKEHRMPEGQKPDSTIAERTKRLASSLEGLPAEDRARPHWTIPALG